MYFITKVSRKTTRFDAIWFIVEFLTKSAHFLFHLGEFLAEKLAGVYVCKIFARHGVPLSIVYDCDVLLTSLFWQKFHEDLVTRLHFSTAYHPQTDGYSE